MLDSDSHIGATEVGIDFEGGSPAIRAVLKPGVTAEGLVQLIRFAIAAVLDSNCETWERSLEQDRLVALCYAHEILPPDERKRLSQEKLDELRKAVAESDKQRLAEIASNPDNGKAGYWEVDGVRNDAVCWASSESEAIELCKGQVGDWESPRASYLGEVLPANRAV